MPQSPSAPGVLRNTSHFYPKKIMFQRTASTVTSHHNFPVAFDIFDAPARPGGRIDVPSYPLPSRISSRYSSPTKLHTPRTRWVQPAPLIFDGPAKPRRRITVTTKHCRSSSSKPWGMVAPHAMPDPVMFDGPSRPFKAHSTSPKFPLPNLKAALFICVVGTVGWRAFQARYGKPTTSY